MLTDRIQHYLRAVVAARREAVPAGAFVLYVHPSDPHPYLNYAIPASGATGGDGAPLVRVARERGLLPRLEYLEDRFPWVQDALAQSGFVREARLRLMTCAPETLREAPAGVEVVRVTAGSPLVRPMLEVTRAAFGEPPPGEDEVSRWEGRVVAALVDGEVAGSAGWMAVLDGMSEVVGVAVDARARRRGIGTALTVAATRAAFSEGASLALLTPGGEGSARVYERAGFADAPTAMIHLRLGE